MQGISAFALGQARRSRAIRAHLDYHHLQGEDVFR